MAENYESGESMYDYMRGLQQKFFKEPDCQKLHEEINAIHQEFATRMCKTDRRKLLKLVDLMIELQNRIALASFIAGFRLSGGIAAELSADEPYSFEKEEEEHASRSAERRH